MSSTKSFSMLTQFICYLDQMQQMAWNYPPHMDGMYAIGSNKRSRLRIGVCVLVCEREREGGAEAGPENSQWERKKRNMIHLKASVSFYLKMPAEKKMWWRRWEKQWKLKYIVAVCVRVCVCENRNLQSSLDGVHAEQRGPAGNWERQKAQQHSDIMVNHCTAHYSFYSMLAYADSSPERPHGDGVHTAYYIEYIGHEDWQCSQMVMRKISKLKHKRKSNEVSKCEYIQIVVADLESSVNTRLWLRVINSMVQWKLHQHQDQRQQCQQCRLKSLFFAHSTQSTHIALHSMDSTENHARARVKMLSLSPSNASIAASIHDQRRGATQTKKNMFIVQSTQTIMTCYLYFLCAYSICALLSFRSFRLLRFLRLFWAPNVVHFSLSLSFSLHFLRELRRRPITHFLRSLRPLTKMRKILFCRRLVNASIFPYMQKTHFFPSLRVVRAIMQLHGVGLFKTAQVQSSKMCNSKRILMPFSHAPSISVFIETYAAAVGARKRVWDNLRFDIVVCVLPLEALKRFDRNNLTNHENKKWASVSWA